ncbi:type I restriction-modification system subunit M [Mycobacterium vicinigordonae]|uniref:site-specific DNA-methyltransferase (adenine-specific) n=1 Tax=Mycobacterium vicinigordonae TaxID=1719132 RepID=A0A7D6EC00_9MYCO|nr:class I SAM-dependent DNA methyltransferase [Mycobacterium vicinigordonae]QLL09325.1 type I restriction-modification system subunit M [Mycobacterium vicinigordonae]
MPPRILHEPSTMKELKDTLWKAADKLRGSLPASQYKDVILGLLFLKYLSDAFDEPGEHAFVVPPTAHWQFLVETGKCLADNAKGKCTSAGRPPTNIGQLIDDAMDAVMTANPTLAGTMAGLYNRDNIDQSRLEELIDLLDIARFSRQGAYKARDLMGEVYEYLLGKFARAEGKRGGEFFTPPSVVKVLVEVLEPTSGRIYDPCCGSGGMFVQTERFIADHHEHAKGIAIYGQESVEETWRMAKMNLAIHGIDHSGLGSRWSDTFADDQHADVQMDYVLANPPFNIRSWARDEEDPRWRFGAPPPNNANYAWIQHILFKLAPAGKAGVVMANGSMSSNSNGEGDIRARIVEADLVSCMIALPTQLFRSTGIPVCLWFFAKDKTMGKQGSVDRSRQVLFIDARELGYLVHRSERVLSDGDIARIKDTYHAWRGSPSAAANGLVYEDVPGFCKSVTLSEIKAAEYALTPGRYVDLAAVDGDGEPTGEKIARLKTELLAAFDESARLEKLVREQLERIDSNFNPRLRSGR